MRIRVCCSVWYYWIFGWGITLKSPSTGSPPCWWHVLCSTNRCLKLYHVREIIFAADCMIVTRYGMICGVTTGGTAGRAGRVVHSPHNKSIVFVFISLLTSLFWSLLGKKSLTEAPLSDIFLVDPSHVDIHLTPGNVSQLIGCLHRQYEYYFTAINYTNEIVMTFRPLPHMKLLPFFHSRLRSHRWRFGMCTVSSPISAPLSTSHSSCLYICDIHILLYHFIIHLIWFDY